jgi:hypothetical protein
MAVYRFDHNNTFGSNMVSIIGEGDDPVSALRNAIESGQQFDVWLDGGGYTKPVRRIISIERRGGILGGKGGYEVIANFRADDGEKSVLWFTDGRIVPQAD